ncbi:hypothetical protein JK176_02575 [Gluconobacter sp. Dm-73]|uniref:hypothetical protein n=1 Tax=Gluconobacter sp. Dm-73 TaxID=2799802 RepID=UPI001B8A9C99|nr:hypothetical protein [Gluconobacter sp. Dm-73]MBS1073765.1 hypothetical protein [Gluconobacter sp. Dm-73]
MQNLKLTIEGEWWDSLLYKGRLHLFGMDGSFQSFNWEELIKDLGCEIGVGAQDAFRFAFSESNALYRDALNKSNLGEAFSKLKINDFSISKNRLLKYLVTRGNSCFPFPHATSSFYYDRLIIASPEGIHGALYDIGNEKLLKPSQLTDLPSDQASPSHYAIAIAGGEEGLFEIDLGPNKDEWLTKKKLTTVSTRTTEACDWMFGSIVATSIDSGSYFARYEQMTIEDLHVVSKGNQDSRENDKVTTVRKLNNIEDLGKLLSPRNEGRRETSKKSFIWGSQDKFYRVEANSITAYRFLKDGRIIRAGTPIQISHTVDTLVSVQTSLFGVVLEFDDGLLVMTSDEKIYEVPGAPVNWRTFPRSKRYENHLHVINDDEISIYSFNQDYEIDQFRKRIGSRYYEGISDN